jgi:hypothetical protein
VVYSSNVVVQASRKKTVWLREDQGVTWRGIRSDSKEWVKRGSGSDMEGDQIR